MAVEAFNAARLEAAEMEASTEAAGAAVPAKHISSARRKVVKNLKLVDGPENSLCAVEFEAPPAPSILHAICSALSANQVSIVDSATRITPRALFQRFELRELDGTPLVGERRHAVEMLFVETLSRI